MTFETGARHPILYRTTVLSILILALAPFAWLVYLSVKPNHLIISFPPQWLFTPTFEHFVGVWTGDFARSFMNSLLTSCLSPAGGRV